MEQYWHGHRERLRLRLEKEGFDALRPHEKLEMILCYAMPQKDVSEIARALINHFGTIENVFRANRKQLCDVPGVGAGMADWILMTGELINAYRGVEKEYGVEIARFRDAMNYLLPMRLKVVPPECWMVYTDFENNLIMYSVMCDSLSWAEPEYVIQAIQECLSVKASHAFLVLFTGTSFPDDESYEDKHLLDFSRTLRAIDVALLDCLMVSEGDIRSLYAEGRMDAIRAESKKMSVHEYYEDFPLSSPFEPEIEFE